LEGKLAVITGANSGIGLEAGIQLAQRGCTVVMCCRSMDRAQTAMETAVTKSKMPKEKFYIVQLDLADLDSVESFRTRYDAIEELNTKPVDMLILNGAFILAGNSPLQF
jgi:NAD(P)-dependent dehydrogenase (short-subunit alcohol dehydrogenase family)